MIYIKNQEILSYHCCNSLLTEHLKNPINTNEFSCGILECPYCPLAKTHLDESIDIYTKYDIYINYLNDHDFLNLIDATKLTSRL